MADSARARRLAKRIVAIVAVHRVEDGGLAKVRGHGRGRHGDHCQPRVLDLVLQFRGNDGHDALGQPAEPGQHGPDHRPLVLQRCDVTEQHVALQDADVDAGTGQTHRIPSPDSSPAW